jgi:hypothetical protein
MSMSSTGSRRHRGENEDHSRATRRAAINALEAPGSIFPSGIDVTLDGREVTNDVLDVAMAWVALDRQSAKREGKPFDAIASLTRAIPRAQLKIEYDRAAFLRGEINGGLSLYAYRAIEHRAVISPRRRLTVPLELRSDDAR